jgi:hypothetical protein
VPEYADALIDFLDRTYGLCAFWDGQLLMVRDSQNANEYYRIVRHDQVADFFFVTNCQPSRKFGTRDNDLDPYNPDPSCPLPRSNLDYSTACVDPSIEATQFTRDMNSTLDELISEQRAHPTFLYFRDGEPIPIWINKNQQQAYLARVVEKLQARGICATIDGGQGVVIKKTTNVRSEFWALVVLGTVDDKDRHPIRRKYDAACLPAEF